MKKYEEIKSTDICRNHVLPLSLLIVLMKKLFLYLMTRMQDKRAGQPCRQLRNQDWIQQTVPIALLQLMFFCMAGRLIMQLAASQEHRFPLHLMLAFDFNSDFKHIDDIIIIITIIIIIIMVSYDWPLLNFTINLFLVDVFFAWSPQHLYVVLDNAPSVVGCADAAWERTSPWQGGAP